MSDHAVAAPPGPEAARTPVWEDFLDVFYSPSEVFRRRQGWSAWPVLLVLTVALTLLFFAWQRTMGPVLDLEMERAMAGAMGPGVEPTAQQLEQMRTMGRAGGLIGFALGFPVGLLVTALVTWGLARLFGAAAGFASLLMVVTYAQVVRIPQYVAGLLQGLFLDVGRMDSLHDVGFSLARFLDQPETSSMVVNLASRVDLFTLWATALIAIGLGLVTGLSRGRAWAIALLVWAIAAVPSVLGALAAG